MMRCVILVTFGSGVGSAVGQSRHIGFIVTLAACSIQLCMRQTYMKWCEVDASDVGLAAVLSARQSEKIRGSSHSPGRRMVAYSVPILAQLRPQIVSWSTLRRADWVIMIQSLPRAASCYT